MVDQKGMLGQLGVDGAPPDVLGSGLLINNALVARGATGLLSRGGDEGAGRGDGGAGLVAESILVELGDGGVAEEVDAGVVDTVLSDGGVQSGIVLVDGASRRSGAVGGSHFCVCVCVRVVEWGVVGERREREGRKEGAKATGALKGWMCWFGGEEV